MNQGGTITRPTNRPHRFAAVALATIGLLAAAGCSGDDDSSSSTTAALATIAPAFTTAPGSADTASADTATTDTATTDTGTTDTGSTPSSEPAGGATTAPVADDSVATTDGGTTATTGDITEVVETPEQETLPAVDLTAPVDVGPSQLVVVSVDHIEGTARLPGEIAGPALAVRLRITNNGAEAIDLDAVTVNLFDANGAVASPLTTEPAARFAGEVASSASAEGVYVFEFANDRPQPVTIEVSPSVGAPIAVFTGDIG